MHTRHLLTSPVPTPAPKTVAKGVVWLNGQLSDEDGWGLSP